MSEQGWKEFLAAEGVDDWVVLHGGAMAVFRVGSLVESAQLAEVVAGVTGGELGILMTVGLIASRCGSPATCGSSSHAMSKSPGPCPRSHEPSVLVLIAAPCRRCSWRLRLNPRGSMWASAGGARLCPGGGRQRR